MRFSLRAALVYFSLGGLLLEVVSAQEKELAPVVSPPPALATPSTAPSGTPALCSAASATPSASPAPVVLKDVLFKGL
jgi:hypothetical protein